MTAAPAATKTSSASSATGGKPKCDKCDGPHITDNCPHFKGKLREDHKDAWNNYGRKHPVTMGENCGNYVLRNAKVLRQPGDGSCLFHSLVFGLQGAVGNQRQQQHWQGRGGGGGSAGELRRELAGFVMENPRLEIAGDTLE